MPTREDMNSAGQPFLGLRRQDPASMQPDDPTWARLRQRIAELEQAVSQLQRLVSEGCARREAQAREISGSQESASALRRDLAQARELLNEMQTVAIEWQSVAEDKQRQIEALKEELRREQTAHAMLREMVRIDRDMRRRQRQVTKAERDARDAVELLRPAARGPNIPLGPDGGHARNCACVHCAPQEMTETEVRRRLEAVAYPPVRTDPWDTFGVEELEKMLTARERRVQVPGAVLVSPDGSTERVQPVDLVVTVDPAIIARPPRRSPRG